jgi:hypothetical protein
LIEKFIKNEKLGIIIMQLELSSLEEIETMTMTAGTKRQRLGKGHVRRPGNALPE